MVSLDSLGDTWVAVTRFESTATQLLVLGAVGVLGFLVSLEATALWDRLFGYSSLAGALVTAVSFFVLYFALASVATALRHD